MKTLVPFTGGMDSTYLLWKLLTETSDEITAVNFDIGNTDPYLRGKYNLRSFTPEDFRLEQADRVINIAIWLKQNVRDFTFVKEPISKDFLAKDLALPNNTAGYFARYAIPKINNGDFDRMCLSHEWDNDGLSNGGTIGTMRRPGAWVAHELFVANATRGSIDFTLLDMNYNQAYALSEMPKHLVDLVRYPKIANPLKAKKTSWFKGRLNEGKTPAQAGDIAKAKCTLPNGKWFSMRYWVEGLEPTDQNTWDVPTWPSSYTVP
jgi:hypothetical protein